MLKLENDALRDDVAASRRRLHIKAVCRMVLTHPYLPTWIPSSPSTLADTAELLTWKLIICKNAGRNQYINEQCR